MVGEILESQLPGAFFGFIFAVILLIIGSRLRLFEQKDIRIADAKTDAQSKILNWTKECLECLEEIKIKINAGILAKPISAEEEYKNFQKLETKGRLARGFANILGGSIPDKTNSCFEIVGEIVIALKNRDDGRFWNNCPKLESALGEIIYSLTRLKI
jgi:hypothetical protein